MRDFSIRRRGYAVFLQFDHIEGAGETIPMQRLQPLERTRRRVRPMLTIHSACAGESRPRASSRLT